MIAIRLTPEFRKKCKTLETQFRSLVSEDSIHHQFEDFLHEKYENAKNMSDTDFLNYIINEKPNESYDDFIKYVPLRSY